MPPPVPNPPSSGSDNGSADGYPDASAGQAENLFTNDFSDTVDSLAQDPPDLSGQHPRFLNDKTAVISSNVQKSPAQLSDEVDQILSRDRHDLAAARSELNDLFDAQNATDPKLVSSTMPLRAPADNGQQAPVDLSLDAQGSNYVPGNPLVDLKLPDNLTNDVAVGDQGIKVDVGASQSSTADPITGDDNLFYHEAATDTDVVLAPVSVGLEAFYQLRSPDSPQHFEMSFTLPAGASLQNADGEAAQIVKGGETIAVIPTPSASDASGSPVPLTTSVNGSSLELGVAHQDADISYPINVDPVIDVYVGTNGNIADFTANWSQFQPSGSYYALGSTCTQNISCTSGTTGPRGLYINATPNHTYTSGQAAGWLYQVPHSPTSTAYISSMTLGAINFHLHSGTATTPYLAAGIFAASSFSWLDVKSRTTAADGLYWDFAAPSNQTTAATGKTAAFELYSSATQNLGNWRDAYLGYASINLVDTDNPTESIDTGPLTSGWIDGTQTKTFPVTLSDGGVGVAGLWGPGPDGNDNQTFKNSGADCTGTRVNPCPQSGQLTAGYYPGKTPEGQSTSAVWGWDAFGKVVGQTWNVKVDGSPPTISTSGGLAEQPNGDSSPYALHIDAKDEAQGGATSDPATWRSGVRQVVVKVNGDTVADTGAHDCTANAGSCQLPTLNYAPDPSDFTTDNPHFEVTATDELGHSQNKQWDLALPDTTIDSAPSGWTPSASAHFAYEATTPGSHFQCKIDAGAYSECPSSGYNTDHLSDGPHTFAVRAINPAGQSDQSPATHAFRVDTTQPQLSTSSLSATDANQLIGATPSIYVASTDLGAGVSSATLRVDDEEVDQLNQSCAAGACELTGTLEPDLSELSAGSHDYTLKATDGVGNTTEATGSFQLDPSAPELSLSGDLVDAEGGPLSSDSADMHIDATDNTAGDSGLTNLSVSVDDASVSTSSLSCTPSCPQQAHSDFTYTEADWGTGEHTVTVTARDAAGNVWQIPVVVNSPTETIRAPADCPTQAPVSQPSVTHVDADGAAAATDADLLTASTSAEDDETGMTVDPSVSRGADPPASPLTATGTLSSDTLSSHAAGDVQVDDVACLAPSHTTPDETSGSVVNGDSVVYANSGPESDTIVRPTATGETVIQTKRGDSAPDSFSWSVAVQDGDYLQQLNSGYIAVVDPTMEATPELAPTAPSSHAADPEYLGNAQTQLDESRYDIAAAEADLGVGVAAVVGLPYALEENGAVVPATTELTSASTLTVTAPQSAAAVVTPIETKGLQKTVYCDWCRVRHNTAVTDGKHHDTILNFAKTNDRLSFGIYEVHRGQVYYHKTGRGPLELQRTHRGFSSKALCENRASTAYLLVRCYYEKEKHGVG